MSTVLVAGAGRVGAQAVRQLAATPGVDRVLVVDPDAERVGAVRGEVGEEVERSRWTPADRLPGEVVAVAAAVPHDLDAPVLSRALEAGVPGISCGEEPGAVRQVLDTAPAAIERGAPAIVGAGVAPGLSELLAAHAAGLLDEVDEIHVARCGVAGPASLGRLHRSARGRAEEVDGGAWVSAPAGRSRRLVYFPDPVGPHDCRRVESAVPRLLVDALGPLRRVTARQALRARDRLPLALVARSGDGLGAVHVEVRGRRGESRELVTLGAVDHLAVMAGTVLAVAAAAAAGLVPGLDVVRPGAGSVARMFSPTAFLSELARRGVRAATFEGSAAA